MMQVHAKLHRYPLAMQHSVHGDRVCMHPAIIPFYFVQSRDCASGKSSPCVPSAWVHNRSIGTFRSCVFKFLYEQGVSSIVASYQAATTYSLIPRNYNAWKNAILPDGPRTTLLRIGRTLCHNQRFPSMRCS